MKVRLFENGNEVTYTYTNAYGNYQLNVDGYTSGYLQTEKSGYVSKTQTVSTGGTYNFNIRPYRKIGVFFWASDLGNEDTIGDYINYLEDEGFTKFFEFQDSTDVYSNCCTVDDYEVAGDTIFVYIWGHGGNDDSSGSNHSYVDFRPDYSKVYSNTFRGYMDQWEAERKAILVESCYSGDWVDDFNATSYLSISSSNEYRFSYYNNITDEGYFSEYFFDRVEEIGYDIYDCYCYAEDYVNPVNDDPWKYQLPKFQNNSGYDWFT